MPTIALTKGNDGRLCGMTEADARGYARFAKRLQEITADDVLKITWKEPRSGPYHRRHFAMINAVFEAQDQFTDQNHMRKWLELGAGYADMVPGSDGKLIAMPRSIDYESLDQVEFEPIHAEVFAFLRTEHATRFLWPHLSWEKGYAMVDAILRGFER